MSLVALLDVNVLVALLDSGHVHHELAHDWFEDQRPHGWATSPMTENGAVRILSNRTYVSPPYRPTEVVDHLRSLCGTSHHSFWPEAISLTDSKIFTAHLLRGHRQVADVYLLGLAKVAGGALATFDRSIPIGAVKGATRAMLQVIGDHM